MMEAWFSSSDSTASSGPNRTWWRSNLMCYRSYSRGNPSCSHSSLVDERRAQRASNSPALASKQLAYRMQSSLSWNSANFCSRFLCRSLKTQSEVMRFSHNTATYVPSSRVENQPSYLRATDESDGAQSSSIRLQSIDPCLHHIWVTGQPKVVVGTEIQYG